MTVPMLTRFEGDGGRQCLVAAIRLQQIVGDDKAIAAEIAEVAKLLVFGAATTESVVIRQGASQIRVDTELPRLVNHSQI